MKFVIVFVFAVFMACLESAVVVYLRELYYPEGFTIQFKLLNQRIIVTELLRELSTLIMISTVAFLCADKFAKRFAWFLYIFAIWDVFYYLWLKILINWPTSIFDWDILFLIPFTWIGPVLAPVLCSMAMIWLGLVIIKAEVNLKFKDWCMLLIGSVVILYTFLYDYGKVILKSAYFSDFLGLLNNKDFLSQAQNMPSPVFQWNIFLFGLLIISIEIFTLWLPLIKGNFQSNR